MASAPQQNPLIAALTQNLQELNARLREPMDVAGGVVNGFYREAKRFVKAFDENRGLRYRPASIVISKAVTSTQAESYRIASNEDFLVREIRGFVIMNDLPGEPAVDSELGIENATGPVISLSPSERLLAKAMNARLTLRNKDVQTLYTENEGIAFSSIVPEVGGRPLVFGPDDVPAFVLPHNTTIEASWTLQSANAMFTTGSTNYGVVLTGLYLSREVR